MTEQAGEQRMQRSEFGVPRSNRTTSSKFSTTDGSAIVASTRRPSLPIAWDHYNLFGGSKLILQSLRSVDDDGPLGESHIGIPCGYCRCSEWRSANAREFLQLGLRQKIRMRVAGKTP